eukprot:CAMPEP_0204613722 /NCGR_PEP_ID=MMETSP0717-20131115/1645_1 /ASSEMBLY_ACC=CAM_ASM_000666 /TAXON_ID=230516 /ORGANISM="Chaetoceros curvisetus" /LENGTH=312 /DNA_ID=CAMNT_0051626233 /DNA_START=109 /DNA_END=1047 /DNA_ORIENTATION=-
MDDPFLLSKESNSFDVASQDHSYPYQQIHDHNGIIDSNDGIDDHHQLEFIERSLIAFERSNLAIFAMMGILVLLLLVLILTLKLDIRCVNQSNMRFILRAVSERDRAKEEANIEERKSYIRSVIQTVELCTNKIEEEMWHGRENKNSEANEEKDEEIGNHDDSNQTTSTTSTVDELISNLRSTSKRTNRKLYPDKNLNASAIIGSDEHTCAICFAPYEEGDVICFSQNENCPHFYHAECMVTWLSRNESYSCPSCRQDYLKSHDEEKNDDRGVESSSPPELNTTNSPTQPTVVPPSDSSTMELDDEENQYNE